MRPALVLLYFAVILVPGGVLGVLALRALDKEEAYVEKTLSNSLLAEVTHSVDTVKQELDTIRKELFDSLAFPKAFYPYQSPPLVIKDNPLIDTVFVLSPKKEILWPNENALINEKEKEFLYWNAPFMTDRVTIPVVKNIVTEYKAEIIKNASPDMAKKRDEAPASGDAGTGTALSSLETDSDRKDKPVPNTIPAPESSGETETQDNLYANRKSLPSTTKTETNKDIAKGKLNLAQSDDTLKKQSTGNDKNSPLPQRVLLDEERSKREATDIFEQNKPIQEKIYKQAEEEGKSVLIRNTTVTAKTNTLPSNERSLFIVSPGTFSDIITSGNEGLIPRFFGDKFSLLFWKKNSAGFVIGCVVNIDALKERILKTLPGTANQARVLVALDDEGKPLHAPDETDIDWRLPFVAREIHEALPRWEVAAYLADPAYITSKAEATTSVLWVLTAFLLFAIGGGGIIIIKILLSELVLAQKKTNLVTNVSHELKTPLTSIRLFAEMLMADVAPGPAKRKEYCALLVSETERLSRLINNVLDFSKMSQDRKNYDKKPLNLADLCHQVVSCEKIRLQKAGLTVSFSSALKKVPFTGDRESLTQVLINLIANAEKYAASGREIGISLEKKKRDIILDVMDRGPGIPSWAVKKIFREFFRVDDSLTTRTNGSGLGLTIAKMIINDHGGEIHYLPRAGGGSIFRISLKEE
jgi:signal transduction histidine kinase